MVDKGNVHCSIVLMEPCYRDRNILANLDLTKDQILLESSGKKQLR
jgi:hypothetical protein